MRQGNGPTPPSTCGNGMAPAVITNSMRKLDCHWRDQRNDYPPQNKVHVHVVILAPMPRLAEPILLLLGTRPQQPLRQQHQRTYANISPCPEEDPSSSRIHVWTLSQGFFNRHGLIFYFFFMLTMLTVRVCRSTCTLHIAIYQ